ncbi:PaaI family thioesterase [Brevibacterium luteolum]|uniref:PaaI family thioesterase n=1 Tax=Brevibacterium luteolum TaxID=199591 RepID=UPI003B66B497
MNRHNQSQVTPYIAHTAELTRELIDALVATDDEAALAARISELAGQLQELAADPSQAAPARGTRASYLPNDRSPVTSLRNPLAPPMELSYGNGRAEGSVTLSAPYEGPPGRAHGGVVAMLLDHVMGAAANTDAPPPALTRMLSIDYFDGTPLGREVTVVAWVDRIEGRKKHLVGEIRHEGKVCARSTGLWIDLPAEVYERAFAEAGRAPESFA